MPSDIYTKLTSRKFWLCAAAFLGSVATSIAGIAGANQALATTGAICGIVSAAIYAAAEAYVDASRARSNAETAVASIANGYALEKAEDKEAAA